MDSNTLILLSAALATGVGLWYLARNGLFKTLAVKEQKLGPYLVFYENYTGPYQNVAAVFTKISKLAMEEGLDCCHTCGFYFDDPQDTRTEECRTSCALIVKQGEELKSAEELKAARAEMEDHKMAKEHGLKVGFFPECMCQAVEFPLYGTLSNLLGVLRCYPRLKQAVRNMKGKGSIEVYDMKSHKQWFAAALSDRDELLPYTIKTKAQ